MKKNMLGFDSADQQRSYFHKIQRALLLMKHVTNCTETGLIGSRRYDDLFKDQLEGLSNTMKALSYKYLYQHDVNNIPSYLNIAAEESGYPAATNIHEFTIEAEGDFENYQSSEDLKTLKERLAICAMEERRISKNLQSAIAKHHYREIGMNENCFHYWDMVKVEEVKENQFEMVFSHFDGTFDIPVVYIFEYVNRDAKDDEVAAEANIKLANDMKKRVSGELNLLTLTSSLDDQFDWLQPVRMTRVFVGPFYIKNVTTHGAAIDQLLEHMPDESAALGSLTVEQLRAKKVEEKGSMFSRSYKTIFDLDPKRPDLYDAGVSSMQQKAIMPYDVYQALTETENHPLLKHQKYVISDDGDVLVF